MRKITSLCAPAHGLLICKLHATNLQTESSYSLKGVWISLQNFGGIISHSLRKSFPVIVKSFTHADGHPFDPHRRGILCKFQQDHFGSRAATPVVCMPQCGLAPDPINIIAGSYGRMFSRVRSLELRVGALPLKACHLMKYYLSWSNAGTVRTGPAPRSAVGKGYGYQILLSYYSVFLLAFCGYGLIPNAYRRNSNNS